MKPISLHPVSVLLGGALVGLALALASAAQSPGSVQSIPTSTPRFVGEVPADWWTFVKLTAENGTPVQTYTVPQGHWFVVTSASATAYYPVKANGQVVTERFRTIEEGIGPGNGTRMPFGPGTVLENSDPGPSNPAVIRLWGYLEPVR